MAVERICGAIMRDEKCILPVSTALHNDFGIGGVTMSMPAIVGSNGVEEIVPISLSYEENKKLTASATILKSTLADIGYKD
jgi:L-lactate dehydrogenase